jgi:hypothetical protein
MKWFKRLKIYKASNLTFNPLTRTAHSYGWWRFVSVIEGKLVFNNYSYSNSTSKHQHKVRRLLNELGIKIDLDIAVPEGLQNYSDLETLFLVAEEHLCNEQIVKWSKNIRAYEKIKAKKEEYKKTKEYHNNQFATKVDRLIDNEVAV